MKVFEIDSTILYHGTSSSNIDNIKRDGFAANSYFTTSIDDAEYYAATGGEWNLQKREEEYQNATGMNPRDEYDPWDMYKILYPRNQYPVVFKIILPNNIILNGKDDSGAEGAITFDHSISPKFIKSIKKVNW